MKATIGLICILLLSFSGGRSHEAGADHKSVILPGNVPLQLRWIPPGTFKMGSAESEAGRDADEGPLHEVTLTRGFYLGIYEVTQAQWKAVMGTNPSIFVQGEKAGDRPVDSVSWEQCREFIARLSALGLGKFRLPTEAEWEYACRAGTPTRFYWGEATKLYEAHTYAWANSRSFATTHSVGQKRPNGWGLYEHFVPWIERYLAACIANPDSIVTVSR